MREGLKQLQPTPYAYCMATWKLLGQLVAQLEAGLAEGRFVLDTVLYKGAPETPEEELPTALTPRIPKARQSC